MITYVLFVIGILFLVKGADYLVGGASSMARRIGVSDLTVGLTVVAFGTSAPELVVNLYASADGTTDIAIGNVLGSNITNVFLILGLAAVIRKMVVTEDMVWKQIPFSLLAVFVLGFLANDKLIDDAATSELSRIDGLILLSFFAIFMYYVFGLAQKERGQKDRQSAAGSQPFLKAVLLVGIGLLGLVLGAKWIVDGAVQMAESLNMSERFIGLTVVAIGTSLPELATSAMAAYRSNADMAVGNIIGSNIFNIFLILGLSSVVKPLPFEGAGSNVDIAVTAGTAVFLFAFMFVGERRHLLERREGVAFLLFYFTYIVYLILRG